MTDKAVRVRISGRVQGVFFRAWTRDRASRLGLAGWVRNRVGLVEIFIQGDSSALQAFTRNLLPHWASEAGGVFEGRHGGTSVGTRW